jgi:hypothetical protein
MYLQPLKKQEAIQLMPLLIDFNITSDRIEKETIISSSLIYKSLSLEIAQSLIDVY